MADLPELRMKERYVHLHEAATGKDIWAECSMLRWLFASDSTAEALFAGIDRPVMLKESADEMFAEIARAQQVCIEVNMAIKAFEVDTAAEHYRKR